MPDEALRTTAVARPATGIRRIPGEVGIWVFILGDMTMFAAFFGQFVVSRNQHLKTFEASQAKAHIAFGAINTLLLLTASMFVVWAVHATRENALGAARRWLTCAMVCGGIFLINKGVEYADKLSHGINPAKNLYYTYFFMFTGIHALHLIAGLCVLFYLRRRCSEPELTTRDRRLIEVGAIYWHLVDLLWLVLFALLYLMA